MTEKITEKITEKMPKTATARGFLALAYREAEKAKLKDEIPVGAVIVCRNKVIARAHNLRESKKDPTAHAEILALKKASKKLGNWRLNECDLYVTLEPCPMCASVLLQARIGKVYYGARDPKNPEMNYLPDEKCGKILTDYFKSKR